MRLDGWSRIEGSSGHDDLWCRARDSDFWLGHRRERVTGNQSVDRFVPAHPRGYIPPPHPAALRQIADLAQAGRFRDVGLMTRMVTTPQAVWFVGGTPADVRSQVRRTVLAAARQKTVPVLVAYSDRSATVHSTARAAPGTPPTTWRGSTRSPQASETGAPWSCWDRTARTSSRSTSICGVNRSGAGRRTHAEARVSWSPWSIRTARGGPGGPAAGLRLVGDLPADATAYRLPTAVRADLLRRLVGESDAAAIRCASRSRSEPSVARAQRAVRSAAPSPRTGPPTAYAGRSRGVSSKSVRCTTFQTTSTGGSGCITMNFWMWALPSAMLASRSRPCGACTAHALRVSRCATYRRLPSSAYGSDGRTGREARIKMRRYRSI